MSNNLPKPQRYAHWCRRRRVAKMYTAYSTDAKMAVGPPILELETAPLQKLDWQWARLERKKFELAWKIEATMELIFSPCCSNKKYGIYEYLYYSMERATAELTALNNAIFCSG